MSLSFRYPQDVANAAEPFPLDIVLTRLQEDLDGCAEPNGPPAGQDLAWRQATAPALEDIKSAILSSIVHAAH